MWVYPEQKDAPAARRPAGNGFSTHGSVDGGRKNSPISAGE
jgi:hypothetical protein